MGLFSKQMDKVMEQFLDSINSEEDIKQWEAQGYDLSPYRAQLDAKLAEKSAQRADRNAVQAEQRAEQKAARDAYDRANPVDLGRLAPYISTPRDPNSEFVSDIVGKVAFGKDKKCRAMAEAPLVYAAVVQANNTLWDPGDGSLLPAVLVIATDDTHKNDIEWLKATANVISDLKESGAAEMDMAMLMKALRNDQSRFCFRIGKSVAGDADAWCATFTFDKQNALPGKRIPGEGILPFLLTEQPKENQFIELMLVPAKYYS